MSDDILVEPGSSGTAKAVAADLVGGKYYQKIKAGWGADNTWNETDSASGKRLPVVSPPASTVSNAASGTADVQLVAAATSLRLMGISCKEDAATAGAAEFIIRLGTSAAGAPIAHYTLGPDESVRDWFGPNGIDVAAGVFLDRISGQTDVSAHTVVSA